MCLSMKFKSYILAFLVLTLSVSSCITMTMATLAVTTAYAISNRSVRLKGKTIRQINDKAALMETKSGEVVCVLYLFDKYRDGMKINAKFRKGGGAYTYEDEDGCQCLVPIYLERYHVKDLISTAIELDSGIPAEDQPGQKDPPVYRI